MAVDATLLVAAPTPGPVFQVNTSTAGAQFGAAAGMNSSGASVIAWAQQALGGNGIFAQLYDSSGAPQGGEIQVSGFTSFIVQGVTVAMDAAGNFVVVWLADTTANPPGVFPLRTNDVYARLFNANGSPKGPVFQVGSTNNTFHRAAVAMDDNGNFVVVFGRTDGTVNATQNVYAQRFDAIGIAQGPAFLVDTGATGSVHAFDPAVAMNATGNFVVAWTGLNQFSDGRIYAQRFDASGMAQGTPFQVNTSLAGSLGRSAVAMDGAGNFAITWLNVNEVAARAFLADGTPRGAEFQVSNPLLGSGDRPKVAMDGAGNFVIAWQNQTPDDEVNQAFARAYDADGVPLGSEFQANDSLEDASRPAIAMDLQGNFAVAWHGPSDRDSDGIFARRYIAAPATAPFLSINDVSVTEGNSGTTMLTFTVSLSAPSSQQVTVDFATADGTAMAGVAADYQTNSSQLSGGPLTFLPGGSLTQDITVLINGDTLNEADETFSVNLSSPTNATIADGQGVGTIINDDPAPSLSINDVSMTEGDSSTTALDFTLTSSAESGQNVGVFFATADDVAMAGGDYVAKPLQLATLPSGQTSMTISITINGDTLNEADENFFVNLSNPTNATIAKGQGVGTIINDDPLPSLSIDGVTITEGDSGTVQASLNVDLSTPSGQMVKVFLDTADCVATTAVPATAGEDYVAISNFEVNLGPGVIRQRITVNIVGDTVLEPIETFCVNLSNPTNATIARRQGSVEIADDDGNTPAGNGVAVQPVDSTTGGTPVTLTFSQINQAGNTSLTTSNTGPAAPAGFKVGQPPVYYDLSTDAVFSGPIMVCINYTGISFQGTPSLWHYENGNPNPIDITILPVDTLNMIVCGMVASLSPFGLFEPVAAQDTTAPVLSLPANITAEATSAAGAVVNYTASATDAVDGAVSVSCMPTSGATFPLGPTTVNCSANDAAGNSSSGSFSVNVVDTTPPTVTCPPDITAEATSAAGAEENFAAFATDTVDGDAVTISYQPPPGVFPLGTTVVTATASDTAGNSASCSFSVNVVYSFGGFLAPVRADGSSVFKSGSVVTLKFQLFAANGQVITNAMPTLHVFKITDAVLGTVEEIAPDAAGNSNTDNLFRYDAASQQYIFNLRTTGYTRGTYLLRAAPGDGTQRDVLISIR